VEVFPVQLAFVGEHLDEGVQAPIIVDRPVEALVAFLVLLHHHLSLGKVSDHNSSLNQFVAYEMGCLVQAILLFGALLLGNALVDLA
jgi:hypothetical protein